MSARDIGIISMSKPEKCGLQGPRRLRGQKGHLACLQIATTKIYLDNLQAQNPKNSPHPWNCHHSGLMMR